MGLFNLLTPKYTLYDLVYAKVQEGKLWGSKETITWDMEFSYDCSFAGYSKRMMKLGFFRPSTLVDNLYFMHIDNIRKICAELNLPKSRYKQVLIDNLLNSGNDKILNERYGQKRIALTDRCKALLEKHKKDLEELYLRDKASSCDRERQNYDSDNDDSDYDD